MPKKRKKKNYAERAAHRECPVQKAGVTQFDYKDIEFLKLFITSKGKIIPRRISGLAARTQTKLTEAIKQARNAGLLSFSEGYIEQNDESQEHSHQRR